MNMINIIMYFDIILSFPDQNANTYYLGDTFKKFVKAIIIGRIV